jgi:voltage-gated potassium channel Kch
MTNERCGYVFSIETALKDTKEACCWRSCVDGANRCVWHLDEDKSDLLTSPLVIGTGEEFAESILRGASLAGETALAGRSLARSDLSGADLRKTDLSETNLSDADLSDADLKGCDLRDANLQNADLRGANLRSADLTDADARGATLDGANLEDARFTRTNLRNASLEDARLYEAGFSDTWINEGTKLGRWCAYETDPDLLGEKGYIERDPDDVRSERTETVIPENEAAAWTYRALERLCQENALPGRTRWYFIREQEARRKQAWVTGKYVEAVKSELSRWVMQHGTNPWRLVGVSALVILVSAVLYPLTGGLLDTASGETFGFVVETPGEAPQYYFGTVFLKSLYFSAVTFATLGYGDIQPVGAYARFVATVETLLGSVLTALLVFVLARVVSW